MSGYEWLLWCSLPFPGILSACLFQASGEWSKGVSGATGNTWAQYFPGLIPVSPWALRPWTLAGSTDVTWWVPEWEKAAWTQNVPGMEQDLLIFHIMGFWLSLFFTLISCSHTKLTNLNILQALSLQNPPDIINMKINFCGSVNCIITHKQNEKVDEQTTWIPLISFYIPASLLVFSFRSGLPSFTVTEGQSDQRAPGHIMFKGQRYKIKQNLQARSSS